MPVKFKKKKERKLKSYQASFPNQNAVRLEINYRNNTVKKPQTYGG